jgi:hypothetical protein
MRITGIVCWPSRLLGAGFILATMVAPVAEARPIPGDVPPGDPGSGQSTVATLTQVDAAITTAASGGVTDGFHALWVGDSYLGTPVTDITLAPHAVSNDISVTFLNEGPGTWDANTVLGVWDGSSDAAPTDGTPFCHDPPNDWATCVPGIPAWIGAGQNIGPGEQGTFVFQIQAAANGKTDTTFQLRPAEKVGQGYQWIDAQPEDGLNGNRTYETFTVHVDPGVQPAAPTVAGLRDPNGTILFVHGFNFKPAGSSLGWDCQKGSFDVLEFYLHHQHTADLQNGIAKSWTGKLVTLKYYDGDTTCDANLHDSPYAGHCSSYEAGNEGSNEESLYHLSCLLAWKIWLDYSQYGTNVEIVAHSMGGLIVRNALYQVQQHKSAAMPPGPLLVSDVVTIATPHGGVPNASATIVNPIEANIENALNVFTCVTCQQFRQMQVGGKFMNEMADFAQNPQGGQGTDWTLIGQGRHELTQKPACDFVDLQANSAVYMDGGHKVIYETPCYDHGGYLGDQSDVNSATAYVCDNACKRPFADGDNWQLKENYPHALARVFEALFLPDY